MIIYLLDRDTKIFAAIFQFTYPGNNYNEPENSVEKRLVSLQNIFDTVSCTSFSKILEGIQGSFVHDEWLALASVGHF